MAKKTLNPESDVYTAVLALACLAVLASAIFVAYKSINLYDKEALWKIVQTR